MLLSDKLSVVHAHWHDGILAYQITTIRHWPGVTNAATDALSQCMSGWPHRDGDGSSWSVSEDWETAHSLVNDLLLVQPTDTVILDLQEWFKQAPLFLKVIDLTSIETNQNENVAEHITKLWDIWSKKGSCGI
jgi:hypothetical protein